MEARHYAALSREGRRTTALLVVALSLLASAARASTGFTTKATLSTTQSGPTLANGTVYVVPSDATIDRSPGSTLSAMYVADGATAVIGGLSKTEEGDVDSGIPYLRKIPWIGQKLFGWKSREKVQTEILIFVTVGIADPASLPEDIGLPKNAVRGREYVEKRAFEPGDRFNAASDILSLDMTELDARRSEDKKKNKEDGSSSNASGTVTITPVSP